MSMPATRYSFTLSAVLWPKTVKKGKTEPRVTILITAFNEEAVIREKLENTLKIDYPQDKLEILVASDGSTDRTDMIVREFAGSGVKLFRQEGRAGKTVTQNNAVERATGEIILFSDATTTYRSDVFRTILPSFADSAVGCVAGRLVYVDDENSNVGKGAKRYWGYETFLKIAESRVCSAYRSIRLFICCQKIGLRADVPRGLFRFPDLHGYLSQRLAQRL
jgi:cellulose synthase/poly-beta-1,6-N-acetylglucosamine synthase-like glycosyltransferase